MTWQRHRFRGPRVTPASANVCLPPLAGPRWGRQARRCAVTPARTRGAQTGCIASAAAGATAGADCDRRRRRGGLSALRGSSRGARSATGGARHRPCADAAGGDRLLRQRPRRTGFSRHGATGAGELRRDHGLVVPARSRGAAPAGDNARALCACQCGAQPARRHERRLAAGGTRPACPGRRARDLPPTAPCVSITRTGPSRMRAPPGRQSS